MPTVLDRLKYNEPFFSFGNNLNDSTQSDKRFAVSYFNGVYQYFTNTELLQFNGQKPVAYYSYRTDSTFNYNMVQDIPPSDKKLKAFIQLYNNDVIHNKISVK